MKNLRIPLEEIDDKSIYFRCASSFRDPTALAYIGEVASSSESYKDYVPRDIKHFPVFSIKAGDEEKIVKVYTDKFAKIGSVGRDYYDAIMANAGGRCPICGSGKVKNLVDRFLYS